MSRCGADSFELRRFYAWSLSPGSVSGFDAERRYFVKCDKETTTHKRHQQRHRQHHCWFRAAQAREFVVIKIQQMAGQIEV